MSPFAAFVRSGVLPYVGVIGLLVGFGARSENTRNHAVHADSLSAVTYERENALLVKIDSVNGNLRLILADACARNHNPIICDRIGR